MIDSETITYKEYSKEILNRFISILTKKFIEDGFPKEVAEPQAEYTASRICEHEDGILKELYDSYISGSVSLYEVQKQGLKDVIIFFEEKYDLEL